MRIYISGQITGLDFTEVKERFNGAEDLLNAVGFEAVNPLNNGLGEGKTWEEYMLKDIEVLFSCDAIYMLDGWQKSDGAMIENNIAVVRGKEVWFESEFRDQHKSILKIQNAIYEATGLKFAEYTTKSRKRDAFFARMLFVFHCRAKEGLHLKLVDIAKYVHRDHSSILHLLNKYQDEVKYNPQFRFLANKVNSILDNEQ